MFTVSVLTEFLGWSTLINSAIFLLAVIAVTLMRNTVIAIHCKIFGMDAQELPGAYFRYLANYKIAIIMLNLTPYIALKIMG